MPPTPPNPPRSGHPGRPSARDVDETTPSVQRAAEAPTPHSYGQSAPVGENTDSEVVVRRVHQPGTGDSANAGQHEDDPRETLEDLAGEPIREEGEDEPSS